MKLTVSQRLASGLIFAVLALGSASSAQPVRQGLPGGASIDVEVIDGLDSGVPGATVTATGPDGQSFTAVTDFAGRVRIAAVPPGTYSVEVVREGFDTIRQTVSVGFGKSQTIRVRLTGPVPEGIVITKTPDGGGGAARDEPIMVIEESTRDDTAIQGLLSARAAGGWQLEGTVPLAVGRALFVFSKIADSSPCVAQVATKALSKVDLGSRLRAVSSKRFRGVHQLSATSYVIMLCDE